MAGQVPEEAKTERSHKALALAAELSKEFRSCCEGTIRELLLEEEQEIGGKRYMTGFTKEYVKAAIELDGKGESQLFPGNILPIRLSGKREKGWEELLLAEKLTEV